MSEIQSAPKSAVASKVEPFAVGTGRIDIIADPITREVSAHPSAARVQHGQVLYWRLLVVRGGSYEEGKGSLLLMFADGQPLNALEVRASFEPGVVAETKVDPDAPYGIYHYTTIAVVDGTICADTACNSVQVGK